MVTTTWDSIAKSEASAWDVVSSTEASAWTNVVSCINIGYGVGAYGDYPAGYGYGCGGLSCTNRPIWDIVSPTTISAWDAVAEQTTIWDEV